MQSDKFIDIPDNESTITVESIQTEVLKITKSAITELKSYKSPPQPAKVLLDSVALLLDEKKGWSQAQRLMGDSKFMKRLLEFEFTKVSGQKLELLEAQLKNPKMSLEKIKSTSLACGCLYEWVIGAYTLSKAGQ